MNKDKGLEAAVMRQVRMCGRGSVWCVKDFAGLGGPDAVRQALSRLFRAGDLRRLGPGLYDWPFESSFIRGKVMPPDLFVFLRAYSRKSGSTFLPSGCASANALGVTDAVPVRPVFFTDGPGKVLDFIGVKAYLKKGRRSLLAWAGRPGFAVVNALFWFGNRLDKDSDVVDILRKTLPTAIKDDLHAGLSLLPAWMGKLVFSILDEGGSRASLGGLPVTSGENSLKTFDI
jgi:hypothetical protein